MDGGHAQPSEALLREAERFLFQEARLLDERRFEEWIDLFLPDGHYWVPAAVDQTDPETHVSIFHDSVPHLRVRAKRLTHPRAYADEPAVRTRHFVSNVMVEGGEERMTIHSSLLVAEYRLEEKRFLVGGCRHDLRRVDGVLRIALKRVDLIDCDGTHGFMSVPF